MRCVLFALSRAGARLHQYSEPDGVIIASVGLFKVGQIECIRRQIKATIQDVEFATQLHLTASEESCDELLRLISLYVVQGAQAIKGDSVAQWDKFIKAEEGNRRRADRKRKLLRRIDAARSALTSLFAPGDGEASEPAGQDAGQGGPSLPVDETPSGEEITMSTAEGEGAAIVPVDPAAHSLVLPDNPGMLVRDRHQQTMEIRVDPAMFPDRSRFLRICPNCSATNLHTGLFCSQCGKALVLEAAVKGEIGAGIISHANSGMRYAVIGFLPPLVLLSIGAGPLLFAGGALSLTSLWTAFIRSLTSIGNTTSQGFVLATIPVLLLVALPSFLLGRKAVSESQKATLHLNLSFVLDRAGRRRAALGTALGWLDTYAGISLFVLVVAASILKG
jgi:hypothetical protein